MDYYHTVGSHYLTVLYSFISKEIFKGTGEDTTFTNFAEPNALRKGRGEQSMLGIFDSVKVRVVVRGRQEGQRTLSKLQST